MNRVLNVANYYIPLPILFEMNRKDVIKREKENVLEIVNLPDDIHDLVETFDPTSNIIISTYENENLITKNIDQSLSLNLNKEINLSVGRCVVSNNFPVCDFRPRIKIACPLNIFLRFEDSKRLIFKLYDDYLNLRQCDNIIYQDFKFTAYMDPFRIRESKQTFVLKKGQPFINLCFLKAVNCNTDKIKINLVENNEIFNKFTDIFMR